MSLRAKPAAHPVRAGIPIGDLAADCIRRSRCWPRSTGATPRVQARPIDISMLDCQAAMLCYQAAYYLPFRRGARPPGLAVMSRFPPIAASRRRTAITLS